MGEDVDVVVIGGGIAGGAIGCALARAGVAVEILELQEAYHEQNRGECLSPWGAGEAERLGVADALFDAGPAPILRWTQWDEIYQPDEAPTVDLAQFAWGASSPFAIHHYRTCESFAAAAVASGATLRMGIRDRGASSTGRACTRGSSATPGASCGRCRPAPAGRRASTAGTTSRHHARR